MNKIEREDLLTYRFLSNPTESPDQKKLCFVVSHCDKEENRYCSNLWIYDKASGKAPFQLTAQDKEGSFLWDDDDTILFPAIRLEADKKRVEAKEIFTSFYRISIHGGEAKKAFELPLSVQKLEKIKDGLYVVMAGVDMQYPDYHLMTKEEKEAVSKEKKENADYEVLDEIPFWINGGSFIQKTRTGLFLFDEKNGSVTRITSPSFNTGVYEAAGDRIYFSGETFETEPTYKDNLYYYDLNDGKIVPVDESRTYSISNLFWIKDRLILLASDNNSYGINENARFYELKEDGSLISLFAPYDNAIYSSIGSDCRYGHSMPHKVYGDTLYFVTTIRNASHLYALHADGQITPVIEKEGSIDGFAIAGDTLYAIGMYDGRLEELYEMPVAGGNLAAVTSFNTDALKDKYVAEFEKMTIQGATTDIDGWVLKPIDYDPAKTYPAVLEIHGGPKTVYGEVFYHEMQCLASEGYFVFFCNPEGSDGRGDAFADIRGKYGTIDYDSIMLFTDAVLKKYPQIDPKRVAVTGGSYGGFMTNWIIGHTNRFACAATQRSISNWISMYGISDIGTMFSIDQQGQDLLDGTDKLWWHSPLKYIANMTTPTLFIHSNEDYRCPISEGIQLYTALVHKGVPARMCYFKGENHELSRSGKPLHRLRRLQEITEWILKYTK
ncbi:MAG: S9 family peptidase [Lachnospiraceae bacterium]|nr:S9 family peptidase [Lachnospiraceae bacterium]